MIPGIIGFQYHLYAKAWDDDDYDRKINITLVIDILPPCLMSVFSLVLGISAYKIANQVTNSTGKKSNNCLLSLHYINLFIFTVVNTAFAIIEYSC